MKNVIKYIKFFLGTLIFAFGISFGNRSLFGGNSMAVLTIGLFKHLPLTVGTCNLLISVVEMLIGSYYDRTNTTLPSIINMFIGSFAIDFANLFVPAVEKTSTRIIFMIVGFVLYCLGIAMQQVSKVGLGNLDIFIFGLKKRFNIEKYRTIRWPVDITFIFIGLILGAEVSIGTLTYMIFSGTMIEVCKSSLEKLFKKAA